MSTPLTLDVDKTLGLMLLRFDDCHSVEACVDLKTLIYRVINEAFVNEEELRFQKYTMRINERFAMRVKRIVEHRREISGERVPI